MTPPTPARRPGRRFRRVARALGKLGLGIAAGLVFSGVFIVALAASLVGHINAPGSRRTLALLVADIASGGIRGRIELHELYHLGWHGLRVGDVTIRDPAGRPVLTAYGVRVDVGLLDLGRAFMRKGATPSVDAIAIDRVQVALIDDGDGRPSIGATFDPRDTTTPPSATPSSPSGFRFAVGELDVGWIGVDGRLGATSVEAEGTLRDGSLLLTPDATEVGIGALSMHAGPFTDAMPDGITIDASAVVRIPAVAVPRTPGIDVPSLSLTATTGGLVATAQGSLEASKVSARVVVPRATPAQLAHLLGGPPPIGSSLSATVEIGGTLDVLDVRADVAVGTGHAVLQGRADLGAFSQTPSAALPRIGLADGTLRISGVDAHVLSAGAPQLIIATDLAVHATMVEGGTEIAIAKMRRVDPAGDDEPFAPHPGAPRPGAASTALVGLDAVAKLDASGGIDAIGDARAAIGRNDVNARFRFRSSPADGNASATSNASVKLHARFPALSELGVVSLPVKGGAELELSAAADLAGHTITATGQLRGFGLAGRGVAIPSAVLDFGADGSFDAPKITARLTAPSVALEPPLVTVEHGKASPSLRDVRVDVAGVAGPAAGTEGIDLRTRFTTSEEQTIELATHVVPSSNGVRVAGASATYAHADFFAKVGLNELVLPTAGPISIRGLRVASTAGGLRFDGTVDLQRHSYDIDLATTPIDLPMLARGAAMTGDPEDLRGTVAVRARLQTIHDGRDASAHAAAVAAVEHGALQVALDAPYAIRTQSSAADRGGLVGRLEVDVRDGYAREIGEFSSHVEVDVDRRLVDTDVQVLIGDFIDVGLRGGALLGGPIDDPRSWREATGHVDLSIPHVDLTRLRQLAWQVAAPALPSLSSVDVAGDLSVQAHLERDDVRRAPTGSIGITTKAFSVATPAVRIEPLDIAVHAALARSARQRGGDDVSVSLEARIRDAFGALVSFDGSTEAPWSKLVALFQGESDARAFAADTPLHVSLEIPRRSIKQMPSVVGEKVQLDGIFAGTVSLEGTLQAPRLAVDASVDGVSPAEDKAHTYALALHSTYDGELAKARATITPSSTPGVDPRALFDADLELAVRQKDLMAGASAVAQLPWTAKLDARLDALPLGILAAASSIDVAGLASGELHVDHVNDPSARAATVNGTLDVDALTLGQTTFDSAHAEVRVDERVAAGRVELRGESGDATATIDAPLAWANAKTPALARGRPLRVGLDARALRLRAIESFATGLDEIDGYLDAHVRADLLTGEIADPHAPGGKTTTWGGPTNGTISVHDGVLVVGAVGERWTGVNADVVVAPNRVELKRLSLRGGRGGGDVTGNVILAGLTPKSMHFDVSTDRLPFASQGVPIGDLSGKVAFDAKMEGTATTMDVVIDPMTVDLAPTSGKKPQDLQNDASIVVAQPLEPPAAVASTSRGTLIVRVHLPDNVWVRRDDVRVAVTGDPTITVRDVASFGGEVRVDRGHVDVFGKRFVIDHARVKLDGSTELNPVLDIATRWNAPDGSKVTIAVTGRLQGPKVALSSDPPATQAEIMSLLVLGRRDAGSASQQQRAQRGAAEQTTSMVQGMTGAILGQQLQRVLPTSMSLSFQPGDKGFTDARYAGGYQYRNVYFEVAYNAGATTQGGAATGQTQPRTTFGIEWRFRPTVSLLTTLGDTGSALVDLIWQYRY